VTTRRPVHVHRIRYHETDQQGIAFNAQFLVWADVAMTEYFRDLGWPYLALNAAGCDPSLVKAQLEFKRPARFDDVIDIFARTTHIGRSSFTIGFDVRLSDDDADVATIEIVYANVDPETKRSHPIPADVRAQMEHHRDEHP
jgi:acyl-CoA thioester hydrolase